MATATRPPRFRIERPGVLDRKRWYLWKSDKTVEELAAREHVAIKEIQKSIDKVESYRFLGSVEEVDAEYNIAALELVEEQKQVVLKAMRAKKTRTNVVTGKEVTVEDFVTQLAAAKEAREMAFASRMKGPAIVNNLLQQNNGAQNRPGGGMDFESRLRMLRAKNDAQLPTVAVRSLPAPQEEMSQAEALVADMEKSGIELSDAELDELEEMTEGGDEGSEGPDAEGDLEDDEEGESEEETESDDSDDLQWGTTQGKVNPARDSKVDEDW
jgi:hypothetical protein